MGSGEMTYLFSAFTNLTNEIQAFESDGFQVGTTNRVNQSGTTYNWAAFRRDPLQPPDKPRITRWSEVNPN